MFNGRLCERGSGTALGDMAGGCSTFGISGIPFFSPQQGQAGKWARKLLVAGAAPIYNFVVAIWNVGFPLETARDFLHHLNPTPWACSQEAASTHDLVSLVTVLPHKLTVF